MLTRILYAIASLPVRLRDNLYRRKLRSLCNAAPDAELAQQAAIHNPGPASAIKIGAKTLLMGELLLTRPEGKIEIGAWTYIGPASKIWAMESIHVGSRVFISHGVQVFDNNSHSLSADERHDRFRELRTLGRHLAREQVKYNPVRIEDDVWIGFNSTILKGVTIGRGAIVGAGSMVVHDVAPYTIVAGNPAVKIGESQP